MKCRMDPIGATPLQGDNFAFADECDFVMGRDFLYQMVSDADNDNVVYELVLLKNLLDPAPATEDVPETWFLHVGVMVKNDKGKRFLDHVGPDFAHVVVIPVVEEVDSACMRDARVCDALADCFDCLVIAVAVRAWDLGKVYPGGLSGVP